MKYIGEISMCSLLVLAVYVVLPGTVESRNLETGNFMEGEGDATGDNTMVKRMEAELGDFLENYLANRNLQPSDKRSPDISDLYARAAFKRNMREGLREALDKRGYRYPVDYAGGYLTSGVHRGTGR